MSELYFTAAVGPNRGYYMEMTSSVRRLLSQTYVSSTLSVSAVGCGTGALQVPVEFGQCRSPIFFPTFMIKCIGFNLFNGFDAFAC